MANRFRNESTIELLGDKYTLRATFDAMATIESRIGRSFLDLAQSVADGHITIKEIMVIVSEGSKAAGKEVSIATIKEAIERQGMLFIGQQMSDFIMTAVYGGEKREEAIKKKKA